MEFERVVIEMLRRKGWFMTFAWCSGGIFSDLLDADMCSMGYNVT
jgi:hypothetical protein